jgi:hypothetical protein
MPYNQAVTIPVQFDTDELWLLDLAIPSDETNYLSEKLGGADLIEQVSDGLVFCYNNDEPEATVLLTQNHCKLINVSVSNQATQGGRWLGRSVLLKTYGASKRLRDGEIEDAPEPDTLTKEQVGRLLAFWENDDGLTSPSAF